jgi:integrase
LGGKPLVEIGTRARKPGTPANTFEAIATNFLKREGSELRTRDSMEADLKRLVYPTRIVSKKTRKEIPWPGIGAKQIQEILRSEIVKLMDAIADDRGTAMRDRALAHVRRILNWHESRADNFRSPIVRGTMSRTRSRDRFLSPEEIRDLWAGLEATTKWPCFAPFVKSLLLCATRRNESARMHSSELDGDVWTIPGDRYKNKLDHVIPLSPMARQLIGDRPPTVKTNSWFIFSIEDGKKPFTSFGMAKEELDAAIAKIRKRDKRDPMPNWRLHDLRRTARTLLAEAGVRDDIAERCLGHVIKGVEKVYNRHHYLDEKRRAFEVLATEVARILHTPTQNRIPA